MRPTALGWKALVFHALLTLAFYVSPYTNLFFLLLTFFVTLLLSSAVWARHNIVRTRARVAAPPPLPAAADRAAVEVLVESSRPAHGLCLEAEIDGHRRPRTIAVIGSIEPGRPTRAGGVLPPLPRGIHRVRAWRLRSDAPLGLWSAAAPADGPAELVIHAAPLDRAGARDAGLGERGDAASDLLAAHGDAGVAGLRGWRQGDALRAVHWRATARRREPIVREYDAGAERGLAVWLDRRCDDDALERALSALVTLALRARAADLPIELRTQGLSSTFSDGRRLHQHQPIDALLRWTAIAEPAAADDIPPPAPHAATRLPAAIAGGAR